MISGISKKVIFFYFIFINFLQPSKSAEFSKINKIIHSRNAKSTNVDIPSGPQDKFFRNNLYDYPPYLEFLKKKPDSFLVAKAQNQQELIIQSDKQSEINDVIYAEGNVSVSYKGKLLKADNLIYDKLNKKIEAKGNITFILGDQIFRVSQLEYSFITEKGFLLDVKGFINTNTLIDDIASNFSLSVAKKLETLIDFKKKEVINTPNSVENWLFFTDKMTIDGVKLKS